MTKYVLCEEETVRRREETIPGRSPDDPRTTSGAEPVSGRPRPETQMPPERVPSDEPIPEGTPSYNSTQDKPVWPRPASPAQRDPQRHEERPQNGSVTAACLSATLFFPLFLSTPARPADANRKTKKKKRSSYGARHGPKNPVPSPAKALYLLSYIYPANVTRPRHPSYDTLRASYAIIIIRESRSSQ
ncbi:hypothetical protein CH63R_00821 [Colletotrichum higginsianum IMI 349063]|uniref:Uncharacterized protein n=1 Tax=Colletotrichum higginsianum (strain IMI 349063) TaxID=759273 RepID=A0A1B7YUC8_COLHI|nr:hypothetical protein CH63R_00821 [Colletotrichum higginsianum IMI 349063]OBR15641.1 hypothetical protein CH63R_00821 [Colletotrichum higginsianum IMI 349063]